MRRRLVLVIAGAVAAAVLVVGLGTLILIRLTAQNRNEQDLADHVEALTSVVAEVRPARAGAVTSRLAPALDVDTVRLVRIDGAPPAPLDASDVARLRGSAAVSGRSGDTAYAAAPLPTLTGRPPFRAVLATDSADTDAGPAGGWFVVAGAATVALGALVALWVARSLAGPLAHAEAATRRIAEGDLAARVPEPDGAAADDELARLVRSINAMAASLERARRTERDFLLSVSHDLRTPLTSIGGWAEALTDGTAPDPRAAGATIVSEAGRLDRLVRDLLDLARLRAQAFTLEPRPVDLRDVAAGTAEGLRPDLEDAGVAVALDLPPDPVMVQGDADRLAQIAGNLIENAGRYASSRVWVSVSVAGAGPVSGGGADGGPGGEWAVLVVEDDGPGIPPDEQSRVFERLHASVRPAARPGTGTGLGLAIVRELAGAMGGEVVAIDAAAGGARLVVRLPRLG
jgi:two-component system, OmpR family, sensor kinase